MKDHDTCLQGALTNAETTGVPQVTQGAGDRGQGWTEDGAPVNLPYSVRRACMGSDRAARRAGIQAASNATAGTRRTTAVKTRGSAALTP
jgi:hypothetical protein